MKWPNGSLTRPNISSAFGPRRGGAFSIHHGTDFTGFESVHAVAAGRVTFAGWMNSAAGNTILIDHGSGVTSVYMHNESHLVSKGTNVAGGDVIARMGSTGNATGDCCHLEIRIKGTSVDPVPYIAARLSTAGGSVSPANPNSNQEEDPMFINIQGSKGKRAGGLYYIANGVATFLGGIVAGVPLLTTAHADALANRVSGI